MPKGPMTEVLQPNKVTQWDRLVYTVNAWKTPFLALLKRDPTPVAVECNWPVMDLIDTPLTGRIDDKDVDSDDYNYQSRDSLKGVTQWFLEAWRVSKFAEHTKSYGVANEVTEQKAQALKRLKAKIERRLLSSADCSRETSSGSVNETRGAFRWLENDATELNSEYPIPVAYRALAACSYTDTLAGLSEEDFNDMLVEAAQQREAAGAWDAFLGLELKAHLSGWMAHDVDATDSNVPLRRFVANASEKAMLRQVDIFTFDAGTVRAHVNYNLMRDETTGAKTGYSDLSGLILDMDAWRIAFMQDVKEVKLVNNGGAERGAYDAMAALKCRMPAGQCRILPSDGA